MRGIVKSFNGKSGWGFIDGVDGRTYFAHHSGIVGSGFRRLFKNEEVEFDFITVDENRWQAVSIIREGRKQAMSLACRAINEHRNLAEQVNAVYDSSATCATKEEAIEIIRGK